MSETDHPFVSVICPVYNDPSGLRTALESLVDQTYPTEAYEVVVVDNDSTDDTLAVAREFAEAEPDLVRVELEAEMQSSYAARNTGIRESSGEILAFVDADVRVGREWLEAGVSAMTDRDVEYVACRVEVPCPTRTLTGLYIAANGFPVERYVEKNGFAPTCALLVARDLVRELGDFDEALVSGGDTEFGQRVAASGRELHYAPAARVEHPARTSLRSLVSKEVRVGRGITQRSRRYPDRYESLPLYHPLGFAPPHPRRFPDRFGDDWTEFTALEKTGLYAVGHLERLAETAGRAIERFGIE